MAESSPDVQRLDTFRLLSPELRAAKETSYRHGYADGWLAAIEALHDLVYLGGRDVQAAYERALSFQESALQRWRTTATSFVLRPPVLPIREDPRFPTKDDDEE